jgi:hypothetical protein
MDRYFIYEPDAPGPASAPVVLFLHGWLAYRPEAYMGWMRHMVRKGYIVVWAQYDQIQPFTTFADKAVEVWTHALQRLESPRPWESHVTPARGTGGEILTGIVGHSAGGYLAAIVAARAAASSVIPEPKVVVAIEPGAYGWIPTEDLGAIDPDTCLVVAVGSDDDVVCGLTAVEIWRRTSQIPDVLRDFLVVRSDAHGAPALLSNHYFANTTGRRDTAAVDARDFYVTYKLSVAGLNCGMYGTDSEYAIGNGAAEQVGMGQWSDGTDVVPMDWIDDPLSQLPVGCSDPRPGPNAN